MAIHGGKNTADSVRVKVNATKDGYDLKKLDGTTAAASAADAMLRLNETVITGLQVDDNGLMNPTWDQDKDDGEWNAALNAVANPASGGSDVGQRVYENGVKKFGDAGASSELISMIIYGADGEAGSDVEGKVKVSAVLGTMPPSNWSYTQSASQTSAPQAKVNGKIAEFEVDVTAIVDSNIITMGAETLVIPAGKGFVTKWLPKKTA